jgi:hypothetical protein
VIELDEFDSAYIDGDGTYGYGIIARHSGFHPVGHRYNLGNRL